MLNQETGSVGAIRSPDDDSHPAVLVTGVLLSYNCEEFISDALRSALAQNYSPLKVLVSDDASDDSTVTEIERVLAHYDGPHEVCFQQRTSNSGNKSAHLNAVLPQVTSDVIVSFDGDDISSPDRVSRLVREFAKNPNVYAAYSSMSLIGRHGDPRRAPPVPHPAPDIESSRWFGNVDAYAPGGTLAVRREVLDAFGPLDPAVNEDVVLPFRASLLGRVEFIDEPLVTVRRHSGSLTTDLGGYESLDRYRDRLERGIEKARYKSTVRLSDIETAARLMPEKARQLESIRHIVSRSLAEAESTRRLASPHPAERLAALVRLIKNRSYPDQLAQHAFLALAPGLYLRYKRRAARRLE